MAENNVTASKPNNTTGAVFGAPAGTTVPTDATTALDTAFKKLGYVSEDGVVLGTSLTTTNIKEWGGAVVMVTQDEKTETYKMKMIEYLNLDLQKFVRGDSNVTEQNGAITIVHGDDDEGEKALVINYYIAENRKARMVIPRCRITVLGDIVHKKNEPVAYDITVTAIKDSTGKGAYEYWEPVSE